MGARGALSFAAVHEIWSKSVTFCALNSDTTQFSLCHTHYFYSLSVFSCPRALFFACLLWRTISPPQTLTVRLISPLLASLFSSNFSNTLFSAALTPCLHTILALSLYT
ncbi:hypothetical protein GPALN_009701 [Globodera pallida]|nr:hypothetical protein GPALN_009701 [Globodera pallida]